MSSNPSATGKSFFTIDPRRCNPQLQRRRIIRLRALFPEYLWKDEVLTRGRVHSTLRFNNL